MSDTALADKSTCPPMRICPPLPQCHNTSQFSPRRTQHVSSSLPSINCEPVGTAANVIIADLSEIKDECSIDSDPDELNADCVQAIIIEHMHNCMSEHDQQALPLAVDVMIPNVLELSEFPVRGVGLQPQQQQHCHQPTMAELTSKLQANSWPKQDGTTNSFPAVKVDTRDQMTASKPVVFVAVPSQNTQHDGQTLAKQCHLLQTLSSSRFSPPTDLMTSADAFDQHASDTSNTVDLLPLSPSLLLSVEHILWKSRTRLTELNRYDGELKSIPSNTLHRRPLTTVEHTVSPKQQQKKQQQKPQQWSLTTPTKVNLTMSFLTFETRPLGTSDCSACPVIPVGGSKTNRLHLSELRLNKTKELRRRATDKTDSGSPPNNEVRNFALRSLSSTLGSTFDAPASGRLPAPQLSRIRLSNDDKRNVYGNEKSWSETNILKKGFIKERSSYRGDEKY